MVNKILPNEIIVHIFDFCQCELLIQLLPDNGFSEFHKCIRFILDKRARNYWNNIQIAYVEKIMKAFMEQHMMNAVFYKPNDPLTFFFDDWHDSDTKIYCSLVSTKIDNVLSLINREKDYLKEKHRDINVLECRPYIFNRYLMASLSYNAS